MVPALLLLVAPVVVLMTSSGLSGGDRVGVVAVLRFSVS